MNVPYISINSETNEAQEDEEVKEISREFEFKMYPPLHKLFEAIKDVVNYYKWEFITVIYQEPSRIQDLIRLSYTKKLNKDFKYRFQFKYMNHNKSEWIEIVKFIKLSGSVHIIIDIENKLINDFLEIVSIFFFRIF